MPVLYFRVVAHLLALAPFLLIVKDVLSDALGADPVRTLTLRTGWWALFFLSATLAMTPLRRWTSSSHWLRVRRMLGLWAFAFASMHFSVFLALDLQGEWRQIFGDIVKRPYITVGFCAWLMLLPLALTSTQSMMRKLGTRWRQLHRLVYLIAPLAVLHFLWLVKKDLTEPLIFAAVLGGLLLTRLIKPKRAQPSQ